MRHYYALIFDTSSSYLQIIIAPYVVAIGDRETSVLSPCSMKGRSAMSQRWQKSVQREDIFATTQPLEARLIEHAAGLRKEANSLPAGVVREAIIRRAEQAETGAHRTAWLRSPVADSKA